MSIKTVAILSPGDMGHAVGRSLSAQGLRIVTCLAGRSERTRGLAGAAGFDDLPSLEAMVSEADLVLSIMPPSAAVDVAQSAAAAMVAAGKTPAFADCNAISPTTARKIEGVIKTCGASFIDAGIVGPPPGKSDQATRFYVSGPQAELMGALDGAGISVRQMGPEIGRASAIKMCYAAVTKGSWTLYTAALTTAEVMGLTDLYLAELESSRPHVAAEMRRMVPRLPVDAGRWIGEMEEIAATLGAAGLPEGFHEGAADLFRLLDKTPIAAETRETIDPTRTLEDVLSIYAQTIGRETAEPSRSGVAAEVLAKPLTADAFAPYGEVLKLGQGAPGTRESFAAAMDNLRDDARLNVSISRPAETPVPLKIEWMERHPFSGQTFVPVDISRYLMMVAPSDEAGNPDLERLEAFVARSDQGINYRAGVWHHPFTALDRPAECVVFRFDNGSERDTDWFEVSDGPTVGIAPSAGQSG
ncbi:MAG: ureidoglycolate lyase [Rhodospirillaceae bacterium]|nr:ureidoglycolate lyase [Rhodospirillaceae bacterium]